MSIAESVRNRTWRGRSAEKVYVLKAYTTGPVQQEFLVFRRSESTWIATDVNADRVSIAITPKDAGRAVRATVLLYSGLPQDPQFERAMERAGQFFPLEEL